jgi:hypothetical protein
MTFTSEFMPGRYRRWAFAPNARLAHSEIKRNFSGQANMKVFELSKAVVEDGFAEKNKLHHRAIMLISLS